MTNAPSLRPSRAIFVLGLMTVLLTSLGYARDVPIPPPEHKKMRPAADFAIVWNSDVQKTVERIVNEEYYSTRPDPRVKTPTPLLEEDRDKVLKLIPLLGDDSYDVRQKAENDLGKFCPAAVALLEERLGKEIDIEIRDRLAKIIEYFGCFGTGRSADALLAIARAARYTDPHKMFMCVWAAARKKPVVANDSYARMLAQEAQQPGNAIPPDEELDDTALYLLARGEDIVARFPKSPFIEDVLFRSGDYEALLRRYPNGKYRPYALYSHICGHWYFDPDWYGLKFKDIEREIKMWPKFIAEFPDHPGANDAWYRYGRALEEKGRLAEAVRALVKARDTGEKESVFEKQYDLLPNDGESIGWHARFRICYIMDALMSDEQLDGVIVEFAKDEEVYPQSVFAAANRALRKHKFEDARDAYAAVVEWGNSREAIISDAAKELIDYAKKNVWWLDGIIRHQRAYRLDPQGKDAAEHLAAIGDSFFEGGYRLYNESYDARYYFSWWVSTRTGDDFFLERNSYLAAARFYAEALAASPQYENRKQVLLALSNCLRKAADEYGRFGRNGGLTREDYKKIARRLFMELCPELTPRQIAEITKDCWEEWEANPP